MVAARCMVARLRTRTSQEAEDVTTEEFVELLLEV
jgi:hypothetical protein